MATSSFGNTGLAVPDRDPSHANFVCGCPSLTDSRPVAAFAASPVVKRHARAPAFNGGGRISQPADALACDSKTFAPGPPCVKIQGPLSKTEQSPQRQSGYGSNPLSTAVSA